MLYTREFKLYNPEKPDEGFDKEIESDNYREGFSSNNNSSSNSRGVAGNISIQGLQRVFIHPSSINFSKTAFANGFIM